MPDVRCPNCSNFCSIHISQVGRSAICPECGQSFLATSPIAPLSLDDAEALPPLPPVSAVATVPRHRLPTWVLACLSLSATAALVAAVWYGFQYGSGTLPESAFVRFEPKNSHCTLTMPDGWSREDFSPEGYAMVTGERYTWRSDWRDVRLELEIVRLDPDLAKNTTVEQIAFAQRDRRIAALGATEIRESSLQLFASGRRYEGLEYQLEASDHSTSVERVYGRLDGERPAVWILSARGRKVAATTGWVIRWLNSFRPIGN